MVKKLVGPFPMSADARGNEVSHFHVSSALVILNVR